MIQPGQTLENPVTGERFTFRETAATSDGELLAFELGLRPGGAVPIPHVHPIQTERFEVRAGWCAFRAASLQFFPDPGTGRDGRQRDATYPPRPGGAREAL